MLSLFASSTAHWTMSSLTPPHIATSRPARAASSPTALSQRQTLQSNTIQRRVGQTLCNAPAADPTSSRTPGPLSRTHEPDSTVNLMPCLRLGRSTARAELILKTWVCRVLSSGRWWSKEPVIPWLPLPCLLFTPFSHATLFVTRQYLSVTREYYTICLDAAAVSYAPPCSYAHVNSPRLIA